MEAVRSVQRRYGALALGAALGIGAALMLAGKIAAGKGLILGTVFSVIHFTLMGESLVRKVVSGGSSGALYPLVSLLGRYLLLAVPLVAAVKLAAFDLLGTAAGVFMVQLCILADTGVTLIRSRR